MAKSRDLNIDETIFDVVGNNRAPRLEPETGWWKVVPVGSTPPYPPDQQREIFFEGNWDHSDINTWPASFYQSHHGEVRLKGKVIGDIAGTIIFTLQEEDRPEHEETFVVSVDDDGNIDLSGIKFRAYGLGDV